MSKTNEDVSGAVLRMLLALESEFPSLESFALSLDRVSTVSDSVERLRCSLPSHSRVALGIACFEMRQGHCYAVEDGESASLAMTGRVFTPQFRPDSLLKQYQETSDKTFFTDSLAARLLESLDGQYSLALRLGDTYLLARDPLGVKPLYLAENNQLFAFSTRLMPLWGLGLSNCRSIVQPTILSRREAKTLDTASVIEPIGPERDTDIDGFIEILSGTIRKMATDHANRVGILFSGGLDSSILAKLSKDQDIECTLYCAGTSSSRDIANARAMSSSLGLPLLESTIAFADVSNCLPGLVRLIESTDMIAVSTSVPIYYAMNECASNGERTVLYGQGADELFGGYERYEETLTRSGYVALRSQMFGDLLKLGDTIPAYDKIGAPKNLELLAPFLDRSAVRCSLGISPELKLIRKDGRTVRKHFLHRVASRIGLPTNLLQGQKVAIQFGSGVAGLMDKMARQAGFTERLARESGFLLPVKALLKDIGRKVNIPT